MRALRVGLTFLLALSLTLTGGVVVGAEKTARDLLSDATVSRPTVDRAYALVQLTGAPLSTYAKTKPAAGKKIDFNSATVKSYRAKLAALRNDYKQWLRANAPNAKVTGQYDIALNAVAVKLNGHTLAQISATPLVLHAEYEGLYYPTMNVSLGIIHAATAWAAGGGPANAGAGVKVAVIDSGIDADHPFFDETGYSCTSGFPKGDPTLTSCKVIVAKVFHNKAISRGYTAEAINSHGTHVAGTIAGNHDTTATVEGISIPGLSGVAPRAFLGNYNVFPDEVPSARSEDILNALEAAYVDGMDIANMSLGGGSSGIQDLLTMAVDNLDVANMVVAVAAGNSGPGHYTVESPGMAPRALTAGASSVPHFVGQLVDIVGGPQDMRMAAGEFETFGTLTDDIRTADSVDGAGTGLACSALPASSMDSRIALIRRGACTFTTKVRNAQNAGAIGAILYNSVAGDPIAMAQDGTSPVPTIPAGMVSKADGLAAKAFLDSSGGNGTASVDGSFTYFSNTGNVDIMAGFSSQGPTDVDFRIKPDLVAPGVNVLSSVPVAGSGDDWAFFQGTSMATPHLAGAAAVMRWLHPSWSAAQIRSAIVNTAERGVLKDFLTGSSLVADVQITGAGRLDLGAASGTTVLADPVSVSFGELSPVATWSRSAAVKLTNPTGGSQTYTLSISGGPAPATGVSFAVSTGSVTLAGGATDTVLVTLTTSKSSPANFYQGYLEIDAASTGSGSDAHLALFLALQP